MVSWLDVFIYINTSPPRTPITIEWNKNLPLCGSTCDIQEFKAFTDLPNDLPFVGSLTASRTSFGPKNTFTFDVPGMEFFATTGEYQKETEWRNPAGTWSGQIIPKGWSSTDSSQSELNGSTGTWSFDDDKGLLLC